MRKLITTIALLALVGTSVSIAQRAGSSIEEAVRMNFPNQLFEQPPPKCRSGPATLSS